MNDVLIPYLQLKESNLSDEMIDWILDNIDPEQGLSVILDEDYAGFERLKRQFAQQNDECSPRQRKDLA